MPKQTPSTETAVPAAGATPPAPANFEAAIDELEKIVARMETGDLSLEDSLAAHKRGLELAQYCQGVLARAQQQVRVLEQDTLKALSETEPDE
ncbi:MAG: exodeoxyribonuclease VII small subunit [Betaproteobacteria bacterium]|nr:exodeoxyribonuclease VII small subunit [Betaproteobacteria bacterium]